MRLGRAGSTRVLEKHYQEKQDQNVKKYESTQMILLTDRVGAMVASSAAHFATKKMLIKSVFQPGYFY